MPETKSAPTENGLYAALAAFQAAIPHIAKGAEADAGTYTYKYADLADICKTAMPLLGKLGLAFTSRPTLNAAGQFVLAYKLTHSSGECEAGEYLLPSPEKVKPQSIGSAITYAKRYSFCAVTGIHPAGEDDDARQAQDLQQDDWRHLPPVERPRNGSNGGGQVSRPAVQEPATAATTAEVDEEAQEIAGLAHEARTLADLSALHAKAHGAGKLSAVVANPATGGKGALGPYLNWRRAQVQAEISATKELEKAGEAAGLTGEALDARAEEIMGVSINGASAAQLKEAAAALSGAGAPA